MPIKVCPNCRNPKCGNWAACARRAQAIAQREAEAKREKLHAEVVAQAVKDRFSAVWEATFTIVAQAELLARERSFAYRVDVEITRRSVTEVVRMVLEETWRQLAERGVPEGTQLHNNVTLEVIKRALDECQTLKSMSRYDGTRPRIQDAVRSRAEERRKRYLRGD